MNRPAPFTRAQLCDFIRSTHSLAANLREEPRNWRAVLEHLDELHPSMYSIANAEHDGACTNDYRVFRTSVEAHRKFVDTNIEPSFLRGQVSFASRQHLVTSLRELVNHAQALEADTSFGTPVELA